MQVKIGWYAATPNRGRAPKEARDNYKDNAVDEAILLGQTSGPCIVSS
jgi:hypothetical protein